MKEFLRSVHGDQIQVASSSTNLLQVLAPAPRYLAFYALQVQQLPYERPLQLCAARVAVQLAPTEQEAAIDLHQTLGDLYEHVQPAVDARRQGKGHGDARDGEWRRRLEEVQDVHVVTRLSIVAPPSRLQAHHGKVMARVVAERWCAAVELTPRRKAVGGRMKLRDGAC